MTTDARRYPILSFSYAVLCRFIFQHGQCAKGYFFDPDEAACVHCGGDGEGASLAERFMSSPTLIVAAVVVLLLPSCWILDRTATFAGGRLHQTLKKAKAAAQKAATKARLLVSNLQIVLGISFNCIIAFPDLFEKVLAPLNFANLDVIPSLGLDCAFSEFDYAHRMVVITLLPMVIALLMLLKLGATRLVNGFDPDHKELQKLTFLLHLMEFFVLVPVSTTVLHFNKCITFYHEDGSEEEYLARDFRVDCKSKRYDDYKIYAVAMILVYPVGIPLHYATLLWSNREALQSGDAEAVERTHLSFLVGSYTKENFWFEVLESVKRILLGSIIGIVSESAAAAPVMGLLVSIAFLVAYTRCRPFKVKSDSNLAEVLAVSLCLFFTAALMIKVDATSDDEDDQEIFGLLLIAVLAAGPVLSAVEVFWDWLVVGARTKEGGEEEETEEGGEVEAEHGADHVSLNVANPPVSMQKGVEDSKGEGGKRSFDTTPVGTSL